jgi:hypothetical protein
MGPRNGTFAPRHAGAEHPKLMNQQWHLSGIQPPAIH